MKKIEAFTQPFELDEVKQSPARQEYNVDLLAKGKMELVVSSAVQKK